ncbi:transcriptional regulator [Staphylococcus devriesei]|nr:transcriptional regulator [Staphylococcus devriesei]
MDRAFRILTIYNRLLQHKVVNKKSLTLELKSSPRSIQRDIDDIRNFLYEANDWIGTENEITYDYKSESYVLTQNKNEIENVHFMYDILSSLYFTRPMLSRYFYQYLKILILRHHSENQKMLLKYLNNFAIDENHTLDTPGSIVVRALNENKYLQYNKKLLLPLSLYYQKISFHLVYQLNNEIFISDINEMNLTITNKSFDQHKTDNIHTYVTFEIARDLWLKIHKYYYLHTIDNYEENYLIVTLKITKIEAIQLCFMYRSNVRVISPSNIKDEVIDELLSLQATYLKQHILK